MRVFGTSLKICRVFLAIRQFLPNRFLNKEAAVLRETAQLCLLQYIQVASAVAVADTVAADSVVVGIVVVSGVIPYHLLLMVAFH